MSRDALQMVFQIKSGRGENEWQVVREGQVQGRDERVLGDQVVVDGGIPPRASRWPIVWLATRHSLHAAGVDCSPISSPAPNRSP